MPCPQSQRDAPMSAQAIGWVDGPNNRSKPRRGGPNRDTMNHTNNVHRHDTLGPPRWGFERGVATVNQADGLGWHRDATLWRKTVKPANATGIPAKIARMFSVPKGRPHVSPGQSAFGGGYGRDNPTSPPT